MKRTSIVRIFNPFKHKFRLKNADNKKMTKKKTKSLFAKCNEKPFGDFIPGFPSATREKRPGKSKNSFPNAPH